MFKSNIVCVLKILQTKQWMMDSYQKCYVLSNLQVYLDDIIFQHQCFVCKIFNTYPIFDLIIDLRSSIVDL